MPLMKSCCCWFGLRTGCYAAAAFTACYYTTSVCFMGRFVHEESKYFSGETEHLVSESFLEPGKISRVSVVLYTTLLVTASIGLLSCLMLVYGVLQDMKRLLLPWLITLLVDSFVEISNICHLLFLQATTPNYNPVNSFLFTLDFFVYVVNTYAWICVFSQYQEYRDGRGTRQSEAEDMVVRYTAAAAAAANLPQPSGAQPSPSGSTSAGARRRSVLVSMNRPSITVTHVEPDDISEAPPTVVPPTPGPSKPNRPPGEKHVQFPDECDMEEINVIPARELREPEASISLWIDSETAKPER